MSERGIDGVTQVEEESLWNVEKRCGYLEEM